MTMPLAEIVRYVVNGLIATAVHYGVLTLNLSLLGFQSAGLANFVAAIFGIATSFIGNRYFVFHVVTQNIWRQSVKFVGLYGAFALFHGLFLWAWSDFGHLDHRAGFVVATAIQVSLSYLGNKSLVFKT
jgi:putative flippase GtrA